MRAIGYVRVSTKDQAENGVSLNEQSVKINAMCLARGDELLEIIEDGESGKDLNRPGFQRLKAIVEKQPKAVDCVIVCKLDRLTRSLGDLADLLVLFEKCDVALVSLAESLDTKSAAGRLVINVMGAVSQWEREVISERTKAALAYKKSQGQRVGNIQYGWCLSPDGKSLLPKPYEASIVCLIKRMRSEGHMSYRDIAKMLNKNGYKNRNGNSWRHEAVEDVFKANMGVA